MANSYDWIYFSDSFSRTEPITKIRVYTSWDGSNMELFFCENPNQIYGETFNPGTWYGLYYENSVKFGQNGNKLVIQAYGDDIGSGWYEITFDNPVYYYGYSNSFPDNLVKVYAELVTEGTVTYCVNNNTSDVLYTDTVTFGEQIPAYSPQAKIARNGDVYNQTGSLVYPNSVVNNTMPNEDIVVSVPYVKESDSNKIWRNVNSNFPMNLPIAKIRLKNENTGVHGIITFKDNANNTGDEICYVRSSSSGVITVRIAGVWVYDITEGTDVGDDWYEFNLPKPGYYSSYFYESISDYVKVFAENVNTATVYYRFRLETNNIIHQEVVTIGTQIPLYVPEFFIKRTEGDYRVLYWADQYRGVTNYPEGVVDGIMPNSDVYVSVGYNECQRVSSDSHFIFYYWIFPDGTRSSGGSLSQKTYNDYIQHCTTRDGISYRIEWLNAYGYTDSDEDVIVRGNAVEDTNSYINFVDYATGSIVSKFEFTSHGLISGPVFRLLWDEEKLEVNGSRYELLLGEGSERTETIRTIFVNQPVGTTRYYMPGHDVYINVRDVNSPGTYKLIYRDSHDYYEEPLGVKEFYRTEYYSAGQTITPYMEYSYKEQAVVSWKNMPTDYIMPAHDVIVWASFQQDIKTPHYIKYVVSGEVWRSIQYLPGNTIVHEKPLNVPNGYTFLGWYPNITTMPDFDVTLTAQLKEIPIVRNKHIANFTIDGKIIEHREIYSNDQIAVPTVNCEDGYRVKWGNFPFIMPDEDIEITGTLVKMEPKMYKATYVIDGKAYSAVNYYVGDSVFEKEVPEVEGYTFSGWKDIPEKMPASDITITGEYVKSDSLSRYTVIYKINDKIYRSRIVDAGSRVDIIDYPTKNGYVFSGWSISESFEMPDHDVEIVGVFTVGGETGKYTINYYVEGEPLRKKSRAASNKTYDLYASDEYFTGETINLPAEPTSDNKVFLGWSGLTTTMPDENVNVYAKFATRGVESLTEVYKMPVIREKLINSSSGNVRPGNKLETVLLPESDYTVDDEVIKIRRVAVVTPDGQQQDTSYYLTSTRAAEIYGETEDSETESYIKIGDEFYDCVVRGDGTFNVYTTQPEDMPETYYELTDRVTYEDGVFYEIIKTPEGSSEEYVKGNELYIRQRDRAVYGKFQDGKPTLLEDEQGYFTNWVYKFTLYNNHNTEVYYYQTLERKDLETIKVYTKTYDTIVEYTPVITDAIYNYQWYPKGDFANLPDDAIELASAGITKTDYVNVGAALDGNVLTIFFISAVDAADGYSVIYIMDGDDRIAMLTGNEGDTISYPTDLKKTGYKFKGFEQPVPTVFAHNPQSVMTVWEKDEDALPEPDADVVKHKVTWMIPDYNWKYQILVEVGADIPSAPDPGISNITVTSWLLKSTVFTGNKMPDFDVTYEAVYRETGEPTVD